MKTKKELFFILEQSTPDLTIEVHFQSLILFEMIEELGKGEPGAWLRVERGYRNRTSLTMRRQNKDLSI